MIADIVKMPPRTKQVADRAHLPVRLAMATMSDLTSGVGDGQGSWEMIYEGNEIIT